MALPVERFTVSLAADVYDRLMHTAAQVGTSRSTVISVLLDSALPPARSPDPLPAVLAAVADARADDRHVIGFAPVKRGGSYGHGQCSCGQWRSARTGSRRQALAWGQAHIRNLAG